MMLGNYDIVRGLAAQWDFDAVFFLQPTVWTGAKRLTPEEALLRDGASAMDGFPVGCDPDWEPILVACYMRLEEAADSLPDMYSLVPIFDDADETVYIDYTGVHLTPFGNGIAAEEMARFIVNSGYLGDLLYEYNQIADTGGPPSIP